MASSSGIRRRREFSFDDMVKHEDTKAQYREVSIRLDSLEGSRVRPRGFDEVSRDLHQRIGVLLDRLREGGIESQTGIDTIERYLAIANVTGLSDRLAVISQFPFEEAKPKKEEEHSWTCKDMFMGCVRAISGLIWREAPQTADHTRDPGSMGAGISDVLGRESLPPPPPSRPVVPPPPRDPAAPAPPGGAAPQVQFDLPRAQVRIGERTGIQNRNNSCTIASLLYSWFGTSTALDHLLLAPRAGDTPAARALKGALRPIAQQLRETGYVSGDQLIALRQVLLPHEAARYAGREAEDVVLPFTEANEFVRTRICDVLQIPQQLVQMDFVFHGAGMNIRMTMQEIIDEQMVFIQRLEPLQRPIIDEGTDVVCIGLPRQIERHEFTAEGGKKETIYVDNRAYSCDPSLEMTIEGIRYRLQSALCIRAAHTVSYTFRENGDVLFFDSQVDSKPVGPKEPLFFINDKGESEFLEMGHRSYEIEPGVRYAGNLRDGTINREDYERMVRDGIYYTYVRVR